MAHRTAAQYSSFLICGCVRIGGACACFSSSSARPAAIASSITVRSGALPLDGMDILTEPDAESVVEPARCRPPHPPFLGSRRASPEIQYAHMPACCTKISGSRLRRKTQGISKGGARRCCARAANSRSLLAVVLIGGAEEAATDFDEHGVLNRAIGVGVKVQRHEAAATSTARCSSSGGTCQPERQRS